MSDTNAEGHYIAEYGVKPTREQFDRAVERLEEHLKPLKRRKIESMSPAELKSTYLEYREALARLHEFEHREVSNFMRDWWRIDEIKDVDKVRRRANRQHNLARSHFTEIKREIVARGDEGTKVIKELFLEGDWGLRVEFTYHAEEHFPDEAEPFFEAMAGTLPGDGEDQYGPPHRRSRYKEVLERIRGYRARGTRSMAPGLAAAEGTGLEPALSRLDQAPTEFPARLFDHFAAAVFTGKLTMEWAAVQAWKAVVAEKRLDDVYQEKAELAEFDYHIRHELVSPIFEYYGDRPYARYLRDHVFTYEHPDGRPVTLQEFADALYHVVRMSHSEPYAPAATWRPVGTGIGPG